MVFPAARRIAGAAAERLLRRHPRIRPTPPASPVALTQVYRACASSSSSTPNPRIPLYRAPSLVLGDGGKVSDKVAEIFVDNLRHGGIPKLALTGDLDRIAPMVLRRLQALPFADQSKAMAKLLQPHTHLQTYADGIKLVVGQDLRKKGWALMGVAQAWASFVANVAVVVAFATVVGVVSYSWLRPLEFRQHLDDLIRDLYQSVAYNASKGWVGETLAGKYSRLQAEAKIEEEFRRRLAEEAARRVKAELIDQAIRRMQNDPLAPHRMTPLEIVRLTGQAMGARDRQFILHRMGCKVNRWDPMIRTKHPGPLGRKIWLEDHFRQ